MDQFLISKDITSLNSIDLRANLLQLIDSLGTSDFKPGEDPLKLLFNVSFIDDERDLVIIAIDKKNKIITLKIRKRTEDEDSEDDEDDKKGLVYNTYDLSEIKDLIKTLNSIFVYIKNSFYDKELNVEKVVYEEGFNPLNEYQEFYKGFNDIFSINSFYEKTEDSTDQDQLEILTGNSEEILSYPRLIVIEYEKPFETLNQNIYQRIFLINRKAGTNVYESLFSLGLDIKASYREEFDSVYIDSINGIKDGEEGRYWEFYVNGEIGKTSVDKQKLEEDDIVEWRLAESRSGCGGAGGRELIDLITVLNKGKHYLSGLGRTPPYLI